MSKYCLTFANDAGKPLKYLEEEHNELKDLIDASDIHATWDPFTRRKRLVEHLLKLRETLEVFSYSGHAGGEFLISEEDRTNIQGIAGLLGSCPKIKIVVLNGCGTQKQVEWLQEKGIAVVVFTYSEVKDQLAKIFSVTFFRSLIQGYSVKQAFEDAKDAVLTEDKNISFQSFRGIERKNIQPNQWGIYYDDPQYEDCTLDKWFVGRTSIFKQAEHQDKFKVFFLGDQSIRESIYLKISRIDYSKVKDIRGQARSTNVQLFWQATWDIHESLIDAEIAKEIEHSDAVLLCVHSEAFTDGIWHKLPQSVETIRCLQKPVLYLHTIFDEYRRDYLLKAFNKSRYIELLQQCQNMDLIQGLKTPGYEKLLIERIQQDIIEAVNYFKQGRIPEDIYQSELMEFDLLEPIEAFQKTVWKDNRCHLFYIEGTENCGQDFLLNRLKQLLPPHFGKCPIPFNSNQQVIGDFETLWKVVADEMKIPKHRGVDHFFIALVDKLLFETPKFLVFDHVITTDMSMQQVNQNNALIKQFWEMLCQKLPPETEIQEENQKIFVFAVNRGYSEERKFQLDDRFLPKGKVITEILPVIKRIESEYIRSWHSQKKHKLQSPEFALLNTNHQVIAGDGYLGTVLDNLCSTLNCDNSKLLGW